MLRGVLLHVVEAARPINLAVDGAGGNFGGGVVDYVVGVARVGDVWPAGGSLRGRSLDDFYHWRVAQGAQVVRLAARGGVEGGLIEDDFPAGAFGRAGNDRGVEFAQERIVVIEPVRQVSSLSLQRKNNIEAETRRPGHGRIRRCPSN
jgi:hypothetical protein